jgi:parallel beta-helix repeat protein
MNMRFIVSAIALLVLLAAAHRANAVTYYVSAVTGSDAANTGLTPQDPYKTINKAVGKVRPGDVVYVREGNYHEAVSPGVSGKAESLIVIQAYPGEHPVMDGSIRITTWRPCSSAAEAKNNPNWQRIYVASVPFGIPMLNCNIYEGDSLVKFGQYPVPADKYFDRLPAEFMPVPTIGYTVSSIADPAFFTQAQDGWWTNSLVYLYALDNRALAAKIMSYTAAEHKITFGALASINAAKDKYAVANHLTLIDRPGTCFYDEAAPRVYLWPYKTSSLTDSSITISNLSQAFYLSAKSYIRIEGFTIRRYTNNALYLRAGSNTNVIRNNTIIQGVSNGGDAAVFIHSGTDNLVDRCTISLNKYNKGVVFQAGSRNTLSGCTLVRNGGTCIDYYTETGSFITGNTVLGNKAVHANGITCYESCVNIRVEGNRVFDGGAPLTIQVINGLTVVNNIFHGNGSWPVCNWGSSDARNVTICHNIMTGSSDNRAFFTFGDLTNLVMKNNIMDGLPALGGNISHNLYIRNYSSQGTLKTGEIKETDLSKVFVNYAGRDYHLIANSPAINAGTSVNVTNDIEGLMRPFGAAPDLGPYEYGSYVGIAQQVRKPAIVPTATAGTLFRLDGTRAASTRMLAPGIYMQTCPDGDVTALKKVLITW